MSRSDGALRVLFLQNTDGPAMPEGDTDMTTRDRAAAAVLAFAAAAACLPAHAMTITVFDATSGTSGDRTSPAGGTSTMVADIATGHLGGTINGLGIDTAYAVIGIGLTFADVQSTDLVTFDFHLSGTFSPGTGAQGSMTIEPSGPHDPTATVALAQASCNSYNVTHYASPCYGQVIGQTATTGTDFHGTFAPTDGSYYIKLELDLAAGYSPAPVLDFLHSLDVGLVVPDGTVLNVGPLSGPGATLFRTASSGGGGAGGVAVPEPAAAGLFASGVLGALASRRRRSAADARRR